jgi:hypothetical protein
LLAVVHGDRQADHLRQTIERRDQVLIGLRSFFAGAV